MPVVPRVIVQPVVWWDQRSLLSLSRHSTTLGRCSEKCSSHHFSPATSVLRRTLYLMRHATSLVMSRSKSWKNERARRRLVGKLWVEVLQYFIKQMMCLAATWRQSLSTACVCQVRMHKWRGCLRWSRYGLQRIDSFKWQHSRHC